MKLFTCYLMASLCFAITLSAQHCEDCRYLSDVFDSVSVTTVQFGEGLNYQGNNQELFMDIYEPVGDTVTNRPVLVFAFGGGFIQGDRFELHATKTCERFARAGYVAVSIDYRYNFDIPYGILNGLDKEAIRVFFRAVQDMRASIQYMKYSADSLGNPYNINRDMIFNAGASSGGITALLTAYGDKASEWRQIADTSAISIYGGYNATSANGPHAASDWKTVGVISIAGAMLYTDWMETGDIPVIMAHGDDDQTVPFQDEATLNTFLNFAQVQLLGSYIVDTAAKNRGVCSHLYTMVGEDHPSNSWPDYFFQSIYARMLPRMKAIMDGKSFCCGFEVAIEGDSIKGVLQPGDELTLTSSTASDPGNLNYHWCSYTCDGTNAMATTATIYPEPDTVQYYILTAEDAQCVSTDYVAIKIVDSLPSGLADVATNAQFRLYPNPANGQVFVVLNGNITDAQMLITDLAGKAVLPEQAIAGKQVFNVSGLAAGVYLVHIFGAQGSAVERLVVE
jgi:acetyl esterase/lipase